MQDFYFSGDTIGDKTDSFYANPIELDRYIKSIAPLYILFFLNSDIYFISSYNLFQNILQRK
ncbi:hypothetical protein DJ013_05200 [Arcticibacterium luteifluviistationis]|uniref:Uncharacterized protein n=1 Tax=Arcticibacterium luteifluviistationis TaxID=1784714 RepID=A0A2Z4G8X7_9BACT|nr:hypothetical protein DJ013_05200 [Arcticibacterium luteifluviistationis]